MVRQNAMLCVVQQEDSKISSSHGYNYFRGHSCCHTCDIQKMRVDDCHKVEMRREVVQLITRFSNLEGNLQMSLFRQPKYNYRRKAKIEATETNLNCSLQGFTELVVISGSEALYFSRISYTICGF